MNICKRARPLETLTEERHRHILRHDSSRGFRAGWVPAASPPGFDVCPHAVLLNAYAVWGVWPQVAGSGWRRSSPARAVRDTKRPRSVYVRGGEETSYITKVLCRHNTTCSLVRFQRTMHVGECVRWALCLPLFAHHFAVLALGTNGPNNWNTLRETMAPCQQTQRIRLLVLSDFRTLYGNRRQWYSHTVTCNANAFKH